MRIFSRNQEQSTPTGSQTPSTTPKVRTEAFVPSRVNVLIVEDSPVQALTLQKLLEGRGYHVETAREGKEALDYLNELRRDSSIWMRFCPTMVLSDIMMPGMNGIELCRHIKEDEGFKDIPVILLTSLTDAKEALRGLYSGAEYLVAKPYEPSFLLARIDDMLATLQISAEDPDKIFTLNMDGQKYSVSNERLRIINSVFTVYETAIHKNLQLDEAYLSIQQLNKQVEEAQRVIEELKAQLKGPQI